MLIQRVDVVTGGASASWGSDAVSGVVNFVLDKKYEGFKMNVNGGISNYADDPKAQIQFAAGTGFVGGRAHVEVSGEFTSDAGINSLVGPRKWYQNPQQLQMYTAAQCQPNGCPGGSPMWVNGLNGEYALFWAYGGLITRGPLQGTQFGAGGAPSQFNYGFGANGLPATPNRHRGRRHRRAVRPAAIASAAISPATRGLCIRWWRAWCAATPMPGCPTISRRISRSMPPRMYSEVVTWDKPTQSFYQVGQSAYRLRQSLPADRGCPGMSGQ